MSKIVGKVGKKIYLSDNSYGVYLFKVKENDIDDKYNNKTITITGFFYDFVEDLDFSLIGVISKHSKYGEQFNVESYQKIIPEDKNSIVKFFTSDLFKGIGETKASKIYEILGDKAIDLIKEDNSVLDKVSSLTSKNKALIISKLQELNSSSDTILRLTDIGFTVKDATMIYKYYREKTIDIVNLDIYNLFYDLDKISFNKVDGIARRNNIELDDKKRVKAGIVYSMMLLASEKGDTYSSYEEIYRMLRVVINYQVELNYFEEILELLVKELKIIKCDNEFYQLDIYDKADNTIVKRLTYLNNKEDVIYKKNNILTKIDKFEEKNKIKYDKKQKLAIQNAFLKNILIITGGPGTGKTTIIKSIVSLYKEIFHDIDEVALLAPTGRASKRIMEQTLERASTIHRFLKWNKDTNRFQVNEFNKSDVKFVIIDEFSMVDSLLFESLLNGLKYDTRIVLVGDFNQLPSVGAGNVLKDLIESDVFPIIKLDRLYRQDDDSNIITLAYDINKQEIDYSLFNKNEDLLFYMSDSMRIKENLVEIVNEYKKIDYHDFQIMAPIYKTLNGIDNLNKLVQDIFNPESSRKNEIVIYDTIYREGDKVLQLMNMPDDNVYNGDIGIISEIDNIKREVTINYDGNIVTYTPSTFSNFTLGYVISIHKSQGSEFKTVLIPILKEYGRMLYQKLIYTGVTRSKKKLILVGEKEAFDFAVCNSQNEFRKTNLKDKIIKRNIRYKNET